MYLIKFKHNMKTRKYISKNFLRKRHLKWLKKMDIQKKLIEIRKNKLPTINYIKKMQDIQENENKKAKFDFKNYLDYNDINKEPKKSSAANKEYINSIYAYNKYSILNSVAKDNLANKIVKSYFSLSTYKLRKSKRMSDLLKRSTTKQLFVSRVEIKQTNDAAIVTGYIYDRHRKYLTKKTYLFMKSLNKGKYSTFKKMDRKFNSLNFNKSYMDFSIFRKRTKKYLTTAIDFYKNKQYSNLIKFYFLTWALSIFNINIRLTDNMMKIKPVNNNSSREVTLWGLINDYNSEASRISNFKTKKFKDLSTRGKKRFKKNRYTLRKFLTEKNKANSLLLNNKISYISLNTINVKLLKILNIVLKKQEINLFKRNKIINNLFIYFYKKYIIDFNILIKHLFKYNYITITKLLKKWILSKKKLGAFLPYIKTLLSKIYEKKVEFNIINLKYIYLDGDIFLKAISVKLKRKKSKLMKIIRKSMGLISIDKSYKDDYRNNYQMMYFNEEKMREKFSKVLISYGGQNIYHLQSNKKILINKYFNYLFDNNVDTNIKEKFLEDKVSSIIKKLRFKKLTGIKLEASGRLTKRFTASRALHKIRIKGSLLNFDHLRDKYRGEQKPSVQILRGVQKPNVQYSFIKSRKRMGAFGIKSWLSSN